MYHPYQQHQQQSQGYGYYAPEPHQSQGPPATNPFVAPPGSKSAPPRRRNRKPMQHVIPQPGTAPAPAKPVDPADEQQLEWVLVPKGTPVTTPSNAVTTSPVEPEPEKVSDKLADAQNDVNKV